jgi:hypothetical protein
LAFSFSKAAGPGPGPAEGSKKPTKKEIPVWETPHKTAKARAAAAETARTSLSGAKHFPQSGDDCEESEAGDPALDPQQEAIDQAMGEIDRLKAVIKLCEGHVPSGCSFLSGQAMQLQEMEE